MRLESSRLANWVGLWCGDCAARTIADWRSQTPAFPRCSKEACMGRGDQEAVERGTHRGFKCRGDRDGGYAVGWDTNVLWKFSKALGWEDD